MADTAPAKASSRVRGFHRRRLACCADLLELAQRQPARYPFFLESAAHGGVPARFDILFAFPGTSLSLGPDGRLESIPRTSPPGPDFLAALDQAWRCARWPPDSDAECDLPFTGGWFLYLGYELAAQVEPVLRLPPLRGALPTARATRIPAAVVRDHQRQCLWLVAEEGAVELLDAMEADLRQMPSALPAGSVSQAECRLGEEPAEQYLAGVRRIKEYIAAGDVFQVNLSRRWQAEFAAPVAACALYRRLRRANPAPFAGLARWEEGAVVSSSPERLLRVRGEWLDTRPIAGTRPRGARLGADQAYRRELLAHPKERAEHVMLLDLERNDLGRVCRPGTIDVNEMMVLESYAHVHHIVSNVRGRLRAGVTPGQVIRALFPGGTITGCPKVRCMEIIAELEQAARGPYTGAMGYLTRSGAMDLNILIRTLVVEGTQVSFRAGAGIVADSEPWRELEETRAKARGLVRALGGRA
ncbi:MAG TPA: aminodeoxychorismate synthase component I [Gammaproteobacteria bacterium]|nr:aminodeoxychorismate synthase component I [Gammaproteobacteria bacterium]